jgi:hypothetical protein
VKQLNLNQMLELALASQMPRANDYIVAVETVADGLAHALARHLKIRTKRSTYAGIAFGGVITSFHASKSGQECPELLTRFRGQWSDGKGHPVGPVKQINFVPPRRRIASGE